MPRLLSLERVFGDAGPSVQMGMCVLFPVETAVFRDVPQSIASRRYTCGSPLEMAASDFSVSEIDRERGIVREVRFLARIDGQEETA